MLVCPSAKIVHFFAVLVAGLSIADCLGHGISVPPHTEWHMAATHRTSLQVRWRRVLEATFYSLAIAFTHASLRSC